MDPGAGLGRESAECPGLTAGHRSQYRQPIRKMQRSARVTRTDAWAVPTPRWPPRTAPPARRSGGGRARCTVSPCTPVPDRGLKRCWPPQPLPIPEESREALSPLSPPPTSGRPQGEVHRCWPRRTSLIDAPSSSLEGTHEQNHHSAGRSHPRLVLATS